MPLNKRILKVTISLPGGDMVLDQGLQLRVSVQKAALAIQNRATVEVVGMTTSLRQQLLSQFTAWHKRQVETGQKPQDWINVKIEAGYDDSSNSNSSNGTTAQKTAVIFVGQVVMCDPVSQPPNIGVRITCWTRQIDKTTYVTTPAPYTMTFEGYVKWAAVQMGFGTNVICQTSYNDQQITNPARSIYTTGALLIDIQNIYRPKVAAFIDNDQLIVKDLNAIINVGAISQVTEFIGTPIWTEWGAEWVTLMDSTLKLAQAANLKSLMNPGINGKYVITTLEYQLSSRDVPFYVKANGSPPA